MPTTYLSPGVYVEEVPSGLAPIAGVGTSTAGFIGIVTLSAKNAKTYVSAIAEVQGEQVGVGDGTKKVFDLKQYPVSTTATSFEVKAGGTTGKIELVNDSDARKAQVKFETPPADKTVITVDYQVVFESVPAGDVKLCTNFTEFKNSFGDFSSISGQNTLAHAVYGFFRNGGTRCYVVWASDKSGVDAALESFAAIDEIAIVAVPGVTDKSILGSLDIHCRSTQDRVVIFDSPEEVTDLNNLKPGTGNMPGNSDYAALYFPWIQVFDPASQQEKFIPPSGHMAGIYSRVDTQRGVFKAPANETVLGAVGLKYNLSKAKQDGLNPKGINCIRSLNGNIRVWGARTWGGEDNTDFTYINIRRLFNYLRESIDEGTQWAVFEPNSPALWAKIRRNVNAFLLNTWRSGALFGNTPEEAFFVKCDAETNPPEVRDIGQVVTIVGVSLVKPAEFVIFRLSQFSGTPNQ